MRELYVVAVSEDGRHVVLGSSKSKGTHRVRLDARLVAAVRGELGADHTADLSPKEIQARLRAGESVEELARSAGMAVTRVERFAGPVAGEMARMIDEARGGFVVRGRLGRSAVPLGRAVDAQLADHARPESVSWTTFRDDDGRWRVQVAWVARGRARTAAWQYDPHRKTLEAVDAGSAALGHVDTNPAPPRRTAKKPATAAQPSAVANEKAARDKPAKPKPAKAKPTPVKKGAATKAAAPRKAAPPRQAAATSTTTKKAAAAAKAAAPKPARATAPQPGATAVKPRATAVKPTRAAAVKPAPAAAPAKATRHKAAPTGRPRLQVVPDPPARKPRNAPAPRPTVADDRDGVKSRASVPAWADVLLGTTPSSDH